MNAKTSGLRMIAACVVGAGLLGGPAFAQLTPQQEDAELREMDCVFDTISDADLVALARSYEAADAGAPEPNAQSLQRATDACANKHGWTEEQIGLANESALAGSVADTLSSDLLAMGMKAIDPLIAAWEALELADLEALIVDGWEENPGLADRLRVKAKAAGVPDTPAAMTKALHLFEAVTFGSLASEQWLAMAERSPEASSAQ